MSEQNTSPETLSERIAKARRRAKTSIPTIPRSAPLPLSFAQERIWLHSELRPDSVVYNRPTYFRVTGELDLERLERALSTVISRHESLRTTISAASGSPEVVLHSDPDTSIGLVDLSTLPEQSRRVEEIVAADLRQSFTLDTDLPFRFKIIRLSHNSHILLFMFHHSAFDAWSEGVFIRELVGVYIDENDFVRAPLDIGYYDLAAFERSDAYLQQITDARSQWKDELSHAPSVRMPSRRSGDADFCENASTVEIAFEQALVKKLRKLASENNTTLFAVFLAAIQSLVYRYTQEQDFVIGCATAGRYHKDSEPMVGVFVNTLPLRLQTDPDQDFSDVLRQAQSKLLWALQRQKVPLQMIVQDVAADRSISGSPLFQMLLVYENFDHPTEAGSLKIDRVEVPPAGTMVDISFELTEQGDEVSGLCIYRDALWDKEEMTSLVSHLTNILNHATDNSAARVGALNMLNPKDHNLLKAWNATTIDFGKATTIHEAFEQAAQTHADSIALIEGDRNVSYGQLDNAANALANELIARGVRPQSRVAICLDRSEALLRCVMAVLKCGAAFVPLDHKVPFKPLKKMLEDVDPMVILSSQQHHAGLEQLGPPVLVIDDFAAEPSARPAGIPVCADDPAYVIFTSGSTGRPKGVVANHAGTLNRLRWMWGKYPFEEGEIACQKTSLAFVDCMWEMLGPLLAGVPLVVLPDELMLSPTHLVEALAQRKVTRLVLVPSLLESILDQCPDIGQKVPKLKMWVSSGEALSPELAARFLAAHPTARLLNLYGSSEVAADATSIEVTRDVLAKGVVPIGQPIANMQIHILDREMNQVPIGVPGEIYVSGPGVAAGYLNNSELTDERFVQLIDLEGSEQRAFKSGDVGRWLDGGQIEWLGRKDRQVKIRGRRIELGEIEHALLSVEGITRAAVIVAQSDLGSRLAGYFVAVRKIDQSEIKSELRKRLVDHMVPTSLMQLDSLPLTLSGKLDRQALPEVSVREHITTEPRTDDEKRLAHLWQQELGIEAVGIEDNFFDLGGHSIIAIKLISRINSTTALNLTVGDLFQNPTIETLAIAGRNQNKDDVQATSYLECLQKRDTKKTVVMIGADLWRDLRTAGIDASIYWMKLDGLHYPHRNFDVVGQARKHVEELLEENLKGQVTVCGFSYGGVVAFEVAHQLHQAGIDVTALLLEPGTGWGSKKLLSLSDRIQRQDPLTRAISRACHYLLEQAWRSAENMRLYAHRLRAKTSKAYADREDVVGWARGMRFHIAQRILNYRPPHKCGVSTRILCRRVWHQEGGIVWGQLGGIEFVDVELEQHTDLIQPQNNHIWLRELAKPPIRLDKRDKGDQ